jgi:hypothetical protein
MRRKIFLTYLLFVLSVRRLIVTLSTGIICTGINNVDTFKIDIEEKKRICESSNLSQKFAISFFDYCILGTFTFWFSILFLISLIINWLFIGISFFYLLGFGVCIYTVFYLLLE